MGIRLSDKHLVYSLAIVFEMVCSPAFNVSIYRLYGRCLLLVPFLISRIAASPSLDVISGTSLESVRIMVKRSLSNRSV